MTHDELDEDGIDRHSTESRVSSTRLFSSGRMPNVVVTTDGTVLATWGKERVRVRRSEDGGETWGPPIEIAEGLHGGGALVDEESGDVLVFVHPEHPSKDGTTVPRTTYRSTDDGETWTVEDASFEADEHGNVPALHMAERGITLRAGPRAGRLIRPARVYREYEDVEATPQEERGYNTAIYSDDGGETWHASSPFPERGTGEGAIVELADGTLYYSSRKHHFADDEPLRSDRQYAWSHDGGETWESPAYDETIPDGPRYRGAEGRGANFSGHFGMMGGLARLPVEGEDVLVYSNADEEGHQRLDMTVWASFDGGRTWPVKRQVHEGFSAYSSLVAGRPGTASEGWIYLLFEHGQPDDADEESGTRIDYAGGTLARFTLDWVVRGERTGDGELPDWAVP
jgi:sialidase-1